MDISIVIPAFDESRKIRTDILLASKFISENSFSGEVIVVDDGSGDGTSEIARNCIGEVENEIIILNNPTNQGKGFSIKKGIAASTGKYVLCADAGNTAPFSNALPALDLLISDKCDIALGSRKLPKSKIIVSQDIDRKIISKIFRSLTNLLFSETRIFTDTQCGFKLYKADAARTLFSQLVSTGFMFEIEIILRAVKEGFRIKEFPIEWRCDRDSRISILKSPRKIIRDLIKIKKFHRRNS